MKQTNEELLLQDLCARLPYKVKVQSTFYNCDGTIWKYENETLTAGLLVYPIKRYKPYLFPLSSMTEEQKREYNSVCNKDLDALSEAICNRTYVKTRIAMPLYYGIDWLNKNHFDYRGLIPMGLALDATGLNIY